MALGNKKVNSSRHTAAHGFELITSNLDALVFLKWALLCNLHPQVFFCPPHLVGSQCAFSAAIFRAGARTSLRDSTHGWGKSVELESRPCSVVGFYQSLALSTRVNLYITQDGLAKQYNDMERRFQPDLLHCLQQILLVSCSCWGLRDFNPSKFAVTTCALYLLSVSGTAAWKVDCTSKLTLL